jgi:arylsulfatase
MSVEEAAARLDEIGGPTIHNNYPWGWTVAGNTPFKRWKRETHEGGVCDPFIVHWPDGIAARGEHRRHYGHAIDLVPTILEAIGIEMPAVIDGVEQKPIEGTSLAYSFDDPEAPERHTVQYYEMFGSRALYADGWKAVAYHPIADTSASYDDDVWELYHVAVDPSECHDLAAEEPERLQALIDRWWVEAEAHQVLPLDTDLITAILGTERPGVPDRDHYEFRPGGGPVPETCTVNVRNRSHTVRAELSAPLGHAEGIVLVQGSVLGGWVLFVADGRLHYVHNYVGLEQHRVSSAPLDPAARTLALRFERTGEHRGVAHLLADDREVGAGEIPRFTPVRFAITGDGVHCGEHWGVPVCADYRMPFRFTGPLHRVLVDVDGEPFADPESDAHDALRKQ